MTTPVMESASPVDAATVPGRSLGGGRALRRICNATPGLVQCERIVALKGGCPFFSGGSLRADRWFSAQVPLGVPVAPEGMAVHGRSREAQRPKLIDA